MSLYLPTKILPLDALFFLPNAQSPPKKSVKYLVNAQYKELRLCEEVFKL